MLHNPLIMLLMIYGLLFLFSIRGTVKNYGKINEKTYLCYDNTDWLKGIAIVFIVYSHYIVLFDVNFLWSKVGDIGVAIFFLLSGFGLMSSKVKKDNYLKHFLPSKSIRIISPFIVSFILTTVVYLATNIEIKSMLILDFFILSLPNSLNWYLKVQLIMYVLFWLFSLIIKKNNHLFIGCITLASIIFIIIGLSTDIEWFWYQNVLFFPLGMLLRMYKENIFKVISKRFYLTLIGSLILFAVSFALIYFIGGHVIYSMLFITSFVNLLMVINTKTAGTSKVLQFLGKHSIELYFSHGIILSLLHKIDSTNLLFFFPMIVASVLLSIVIKFLANLITKGFNHIFLSDK